MIGFPFDSHVTFESDGTPVYDRAITSAPLRKLIAKLLTDGILPNPSTNLQVEAGSGMNVVVNPGFAICAGGLKLEENQRTLAIQAADSNYDRIDTVVLRWNDNDSERICDLYIVEGIPAASPLRPELTRTESIWELGLADLFINKNSSAISNQRITDTRYESARCGIISAISEFDTTTLYQQVQADLAGFKASEQADFITWFNDIKGQLSEDAAGNLQKQIGTLESLKTEVKTNLVNALNWVVDKTSGVIAKLGSADISKIGDGTVTGAIVNNKEAIEDVTQSLTNINKSKKTYLRLVLPNVAADAKTVCDYINKNYLLGQLSPATTVDFDVVASNADWFTGTLSTDSTALVAGRTVWGIVQQRTSSVENSTLYKYFASGTGGAGSVSPFKSYDQGYAKGVTDADNRANANSTNYKTGYNNGYNAGKSDGALTGVSGCCIAGWRSIDAYSNNQWVSGWTGVNPNYFTVNGYGIVPKRNFTATVYWQGYNKRDIDFYSNGVMGHRDNGTSMNGVKMNFYAGTQCGFKTNDSGGGSLGAGFIVLN